MTENQPEPAETAPKTIIVFYGTRAMADRWARETGTRPRAVILATNPDALRGLTGPVRRVYDGGWNPSPRALGLEALTEQNLRIIEATRG